MADTTTTGLAMLLRLDDGGNARDSFLRFDGGSAEFHYDHQSLVRKPSDAMSSAFSTAAPAAPRIVLWPQATNLIVEHRAFAHTAHENAHAVFARGVAARLRTVFLRHINHRLRRRARQLALLRNAVEFRDGILHIRSDWVCGELDRNRDHVTIGHRHAIAMRADTGIQRLRLAIRHLPRIFCVSCCIFSSSPPMNGTTLPTMSMEATPG